MAERLIVVCDVCGKSPAETVAIAAKDKNYRKDLCAAHLTELLKGARAPKRGRPAHMAPISSPRRRGRPPKASAETAQATTTGAKRERRKSTDPAVLEKRRAALAKARQVRADKRAARTG
jgi:hypothetical protein